VCHSHDSSDAPVHLFTSLAPAAQHPGTLTQEAGLGGTPGAGLATLMKGMGLGATLVRAPHNKQLPGGRKAVNLYQVRGGAVERLGSCCVSLAQHVPSC
jgi:hypothetical protein